VTIETHLASVYNMHVPRRIRSRSQSWNKYVWTRFTGMDTGPVDPRVESGRVEKNWPAFNSVLTLA